MSSVKVNIAENVKQGNLVIDHDGDGIPDEVMLDITGDDIADVIFYDTDKDGEFDSSLPVSQLMDDKSVMAEKVENGIKAEASLLKGDK